MTEFTQAELAEAMSKLLDGRWRIHAKEIDTEIDIVTYFELTEGRETLATTYDHLEIVLERGMKRNRAERADKPIHPPGAWAVTQDAGPRFSITEKVQGITVHVDPAKIEIESDWSWPVVSLDALRYILARTTQEGATDGE